MDSHCIPVALRKFMMLGPREITRMMRCDAQPMSYLPGFSSAFIIIHRAPARIAVGTGTVYSLNKGTSTHKMQAFWEHLPHAVAIYKVKVNTNKMIFIVE